MRPALKLYRDAHGGGMSMPHLLSLDHKGGESDLQAPFHLDVAKRSMRFEDGRETESAPAENTWP